MQFNVAIGERPDAAEAVLIGGIVDPGALCHVDAKAGSTNTGGIYIGEDKAVYRGIELNEFCIDFERGIELERADEIGTVEGNSHIGVEGIAALFRAPGGRGARRAEHAPQRPSGVISGTFIDAFDRLNIAVGKKGVGGTVEKEIVGKGVSSAVGAAIDPKMGLQRNRVHVAAIEDELVVVVAGVNGPGDHHLPFVGYALDALSLLFGAREDRKEHGRKNADDGDDDEQLDEGERGS